MNYSDKVLDHFMNPRNVGELDNPDGVGQVGNINCGDIMRMTIKVVDNRISDIRFKTFGCGAAIAVSSMVTEMVRGKTLEESVTVNRDDVAGALGGLPEKKLHCSNLGTDALKAAVNDYWRRTGHPEKIVPLEDEHLEHQAEEQNSACCGSNERGCRQSADSGPVERTGD
ncbi:iron-sulfur cluster assembly scaffold protein [Desulfoferrobacter suflitae]|uniref:iron-sulfur cluster assembly scaffold protein n=1 Tax=Desulfoferrobacter suflitae TaxID=2865782 RepID=UPI00307F4F6A